MKTEELIIKHIDNMKVAMELMKATGDISQAGIDGIELGLKGLQELINQFKKDELSEFLDFLLKEGYCDTDVYCEPPTALDQYLIFNKK